MLSIRKTYRSCSELPLFNFIKVVVTGDLNYLYCEKKKPWNNNFDLSDTWDILFNEYSELTNDTQGVHVFSLVKEITVINNNLYLIQQSVSFLSRQYDVRLCDMLRSMGFMFQYSQETLLNDLKLTISTAKSMILQRNEASMELDKMNIDDRKATEKDYDILVAQLSKFLGFRINTREATVMNFINYVEMFKQENKPQQNG